MPSQPTLLVDPRTAVLSAILPEHRRTETTNVSSIDEENYSLRQHTVSIYTDERIKLLPLLYPDPEWESWDSAPENFRNLTLKMCILGQMGPLNFCSMYSNDPGDKWSGGPDPKLPVTLTMSYEVTSIGHIVCSRHYLYETDCKRTKTSCHAGCSGRLRLQVLKATDSVPDGLSRYWLSRRLEPTDRACITTRGVRTDITVLYIRFFHALRVTVD